MAFEDCLVAFFKRFYIFVFSCSCCSSLAFFSNLRNFTLFSQFIMLRFRVIFSFPLGFSKFSDFQNYRAYSLKSFKLFFVKVCLTNSLHHPVFPSALRKWLRPSIHCLTLTLPTFVNSLGLFSKRFCHRIRGLIQNGFSFSHSVSITRR